MASERTQRQIGRFLDEAEEAAAVSDWARVRDQAQNVLAFDPENVDGVAFVTAADRALGGSASPAPASPDNSPPTSSVTVTNQPTSFAGGRYQVKRFLGEGGKKKVYLAYAATLDREVAFALIKTEGLDDTSRTRIQRRLRPWGDLGLIPI